MKSVAIVDQNLPIYYHRIVINSKHHSLDMSQINIHVINGINDAIDKTLFDKFYGSIWELLKHVLQKRNLQHISKYSTKNYFASSFSFNSVLRPAIFTHPRDLHQFLKALIYSPIFRHMLGCRQNFIVANPNFTPTFISLTRANLACNFGSRNCERNWDTALPDCESTTRNSIANDAH